MRPLAPDMLVASLIGVLVGLAYTVSPLTALFALLLPVLFWWTRRGLDAWERRWACRLLAIATFLRVAAIAVLLLTTTSSQHFNAYFPDAQFAIARSWWIQNIWLDVPIGPFYQYYLYNPYGATSYSYVLGAIQVLTGPSPYGLNFVSTAAFLAGAVALYRIARQSFGASAALVGFAVLLFWPTTFAWSVSMLKEPMQFALTAFLAVFSLHTVRARTWPGRVVGAILVVATALAMVTLRSAAAWVAVIGCVAGIAGWAMTRKPAVMLASAIALAVVAAAAFSRPAVQDQAMEIVRAAGGIQLGHVQSFGYGYKVLDQHFYSYGSPAVRAMQPDEGIRYLARAVAAFFVVPWPGQISTRSGLAFMPQQLVWYVLVLLAAPGAVAGFRRDPLVTWLLLATVAAGVTVIAPNSGNIGTLVRHRDMVAPALTLLSAAGFTSVIGFMARPLTSDMNPQSDINLKSAL